MRNGDGRPTRQWSMGEVGAENVFLQDVSPQSLIEKVTNLPAKGDVWGLEKQLEVDQLLLMDKIENHGNIRDYWLETPDNENIGSIMANELGPMNDILIANYGEDWRHEASEEVLGQLLHNVFLVERRNLHGKVVMDKLSEFRDGKLQEDGTWRFLPENKRERQILVEHAKAYDTRRIDVRKQSLDTVMAILRDKGFSQDSKAYWGIKQRFLDHFEKEDLVRWKASLYDFDGSGHMQLRVWKEANKRIEQGDTPELGLIVDKVKEIAKVRDTKGLIESMGVTEDESGQLSIAPRGESKKPPAITMLARARMALEHGKGLSKAMWENYRANDHVMADVYLMNAVACEFPARVEQMGREMIVNGIYEKRSAEIMEEMHERVQMDAEGIIAQTYNIGQAAIGMLRGLHEQTARVYGAVTNTIREYTQGPVGFFRKIGESVADWVDRTIEEGAPALDRILEKKQTEWHNKTWIWAVKRLNTGLKTQNIPERPRVGVGKVDLRLPAVEV